VPDRIGSAYRSGGRQIEMNDCNAIMDFSDKYLIDKRLVHCLIIVLHRYVQPPV